MQETSSYGSDLNPNLKRLVKRMFKANEMYASLSQDFLMLSVAPKQYQNYKRDTPYKSQNKFQPCSNFSDMPSFDSIEGQNMTHRKEVDGKGFWTA